MPRRPLSETARKVLEALCQSAQGVSRKRWRDVYLDSALSKLPGMSVTTFQRALAELSVHGLYRTYAGDASGEVYDEAFEVVA